MTPAERLLAAADLLDQRASEATEGPWIRMRDAEVVNSQNWSVPDEKWWITDDHGKRICGPFYSRDAALEARVPLEEYAHPATFAVMDAKEIPGGN